MDFKSLIQQINAGKFKGFEIDLSNKNLINSDVESLFAALAAKKIFVENLDLSGNNITIFPDASKCDIESINLTDNKLYFPPDVKLLPANLLSISLPGNNFTVIGNLMLDLIAANNSKIQFSVPPVATENIQRPRSRALEGEEDYKQIQKELELNDMILAKHLENVGLSFIDAELDLKTNLDAHVAYLKTIFRSPVEQKIINNFMDEQRENLYAALQQFMHTGSKRPRGGS